MLLQAGMALQLELALDSTAPGNDKRSREYLLIFFSGWLVRQFRDSPLKRVSASADREICYVAVTALTERF
jgi:hypothetical protein